MKLERVQKNPEILFVFYKDDPFPEELNTISLTEGVATVMKESMSFVGVYLPPTDDKEILDKVHDLTKAYAKGKK